MTPNELNAPTSVLNIEQPVAGCLALTELPAPQLAPQIDLSHYLHVSSFSLRFAHASSNDDELTPEYLLEFEFALMPVPELALGYIEPFGRELNWMLQTNTQTSRLSAWKDSNLQYIPQQFSA